MKKVILTVVLLLGVWVGTQKIEMNSALAQTDMVHGIVSPLTNQLGFPLASQLPFTNTVVLIIDFSAAQPRDVATLLLSLQTNVEITLPVLATMTSNATLVNLSSTGQVHGFVTPNVPMPNSAILPPTGAPNGANTVQQTGISITLGTNTFAVDQETFQALLALRDDLQRTLPVLQVLNGTTPSPTNLTTFANPIPQITNFATGHLTNAFTTPLTNQPQVLNAPSPF
jgi:hypothetical protein